MLRRHPVPCRRPRVATAGLAALAAACQGCAAQLKDDEWSWLWFAAPLLSCLAVGLLWAFLRRLRQLRVWDLRLDSASPSPLSLAVPVGLAAVVVAVGFAIYNLSLAGMEPRQKAVNIVLWLLGTVLGGGGGFWIGIRAAERRAAGGEEHV